MKIGRALLALLAIGGLLAVGTYLWRDRAESFAVGSLVAGFERRNELTVFAAQVVPVVTSRQPGLIRLLDREQTAIIPATVRYTIDMTKIDDGDVRWDPQARTLTITAPPVAVQRPDLQEERARYYRQGLWLSGGQVAALFRQNSGAALGEANRLARAPMLLALAQDGARDAVADNAELFLRGAGIEDARVLVRFDTEGAPGIEQLDRSRSLNQVWEQKAR